MRRPTTPGGTPQRKQGTGKKLANGVVALSSAAIMAVYAAGYIHTAAATSVTPTAVVASVAIAAPTTAASRLTPTASAAVATATAAMATAPTTAPAPLATATVGVIATPTPQATQTATATAAYKDGTYTGSGTSKHGGVTVAVVIKNGAITSSAITASNTRYPISRIAALPGEVVAAQSASVDFVSGATDSSMAFQTAVAGALALAKRS